MTRIVMTSERPHNELYVVHPNAAHASRGTEALVKAHGDSN